MAASVFLRSIVWILHHLLLLYFIPVAYFKSLQRRKKCPSIRNKVLLLSASEIAKRVREKQITCQQVIETYIERINEVNPIINAVIENRFKEAVENAKKVDLFIKNSQLSQNELQEQFPLLGVPITIKGSIALKNLNCNAGRKNYIEKAQEDAVTVKYVKESGAIPLLVSNVPELCLNWETSNKLIGTTKNPYDTRRTPGGSSGGEAALLACGASVIGIGSDLAGSLRLPAHCCGIYAHKPTPGVVSAKGHYPESKNVDVWTRVFTIGPLTRYAADLKLLLNVMMESEKRNVLLLNQAVDVKKIKFYYMDDPKAFLATKFNEEIISVIEKVVTHFDHICESKCAKVNLPLMKYCSELTVISMICQIDQLDNFCEGKEYIEALKYIFGKSNLSLNTILLTIALSILPALFGRYVKVVNGAISTLRNDFLKLLGNDGVFIFPSSPTQASYHNEYFRRLADTMYLAIFNVLGLPVTSCPVKFSRKGLPLNVQIVTSPNFDRIGLTVAEEIERAFGGWKFD